MNENNYFQMAVLLCPLCSQPRFNSLESLRFSLIKVATQNISCPICNEIVAGLDKLTIHLFGHTINQCSETLMELNVTKSDSLSNVSPSLENQKAKEREKANDSNDLKLGDERDGKNGDACTVNMEDLSFLTSWENCFRTDDLDDLGEKSQSPKTVNSNAEEPLKSPREDSNQLSEYMSDLLTKKLPILNFAFTMDASEKSEPDKQGEGSENSQFKCPKCDFAFQNSIIFSMHQELVHSTKKIDDKKTKPKNVNENLAFDSSFRPLNFSDENLFKDLVLPSYDCHLCQKSYKMKGSLLVHYRVAHLGLSNSDSSVSLANQDGTGEKNFCCSICNKSFKKVKLKKNQRNYSVKRFLKYLYLILRNSI